MSDLRRLVADKVSSTRPHSPSVSTTNLPRPALAAAAGGQPDSIACRLLLIATTGHAAPVAGQEEERTGQRLKRLFAAEVSAHASIFKPCPHPPRSPVGIDVTSYQAFLSSDGPPVKVEVGHVSGMKQHFASSAKGFYRRVHGALICCRADDGSPENLEEIRNWYAVVHHTSTQHTEFVIVAFRASSSVKEEGGGRKEKADGGGGDVGGSSGDSGPGSVSPALEYRNTHLPHVPYYEVDPDEVSGLHGPLVALLGAVKAAVEKGLHAEEAHSPPRPLAKNRWNPEKHKVYPKEFRNVAYLLLLNSQAHLGRAPNPAAKLPPVLWQNVLSYCTPLWFFTDRRLMAIKSERMEVRQSSIEDTMEGSGESTKAGQCIVA